ncbi:MAG: hypothetical protein E7190_09810 [Erysipelotrichaceae bacterium]|nr:hypothetical protein [Erysipelotrichaceae bacterium]
MREVLFLSGAIMMHRPSLFSAAHFLLSAGSILAAYFAAKYSEKYGKDQCPAILARSAQVFLLAEIGKQIFLYFTVNHGLFDWWYFPFQLCSVPMYLLFRFESRSETVQEWICTFLGSYTMISALCALLYPENMLSEYVFLTLHSFLYHGWLVFVSLLCIRKHLCTRKGFRGALILFLLLSGIAEIINAAGYHSPWGTGIPDMFYISPFTSTLQPVFSAIEASMGRPAEIIIYLLTLSLCAFILNRISAKDHG